MFIIAHIRCSIIFLKSSISKHDFNMKSSVLLKSFFFFFHCLLYCINQFFLHFLMRWKVFHIIHCILIVLLTEFIIWFTFLLTSVRFLWRRFWSFFTLLSTFSFALNIVTYKIWIFTFITFFLNLFLGQ